MLTYDDARPLAGVEGLAYFPRTPMKFSYSALFLAAIAELGSGILAQQSLAIQQSTRLNGEARSCFGSALASGDVNGDGFADLLVGARTDSGGTDEGGAVFLHLGGPEGVAPYPAWSAFSLGTEAELGYAVAISDVNADGYSDVVCGAPDGPFGFQGGPVVRMYLGSSAGPSLAPDWTAETPGPFDYGTALASAGDTNGDGFGDILVSGNVSGGGDSGLVHLFLGTSLGLESTPSWVSCGSPGDLHGYTISGGKDVNGDSFSDIIICEPGFSGTLELQGKILLYLGSPSGPSSIADWTYEDDCSECFLGVSAALIGDINGDGLSELAVSDWSSNGRVLVFFGTAGLPSAQPDLVLEGPPGWLEFGASIAPAGDVNGDGLSDVLIGSFPSPPPEYDGHVQLFIGHAAEPYLSVAWEMSGGQAVSLFGLQMTSIGDLNQDGLGDFAVGAEGFDFPLNNEGLVSVFLGSRISLGGPRFSRH